MSGSCLFRKLSIKPSAMISRRAKRFANVITAVGMRFVCGISEMVRGAIRILIYVVSAVLIFLGLIFMISVNLGMIYFFEGLVFLVVAGLLLFLSWERKPLEIKQTVTVTGPLKVNEIHCPNCGALVDATKTEVVDGKPFVTCRFCGNKFELTEEPTW